MLSFGKRKGHVGLRALSHTVRKTSLLPAVELRPDSPDAQVGFKYDLRGSFLSFVYDERDARCHRIQDKTLNHRKYGVGRVLCRSRSLAGDWADGERSLFSVSSTTAWDSGYHLELRGRIRTRLYILFIRSAARRITLYVRVGCFVLRYGIVKSDRCIAYDNARTVACKPRDGPRDDRCPTQGEAQVPTGRLRRLLRVNPTAVPSSRFPQC